MADFSKAQIGVNPSQPQAVQAVAPPPSGLEAALGLFSAIAPTGQQINDRRESKAADATSKVLGSFTQDALRIADAVDTGEMSSRAGRMMMRRTYSSYAANNPLLVNDLAETHKSLITTSGLGKVVAEGTEEEKRETAKRDNAYSRGWITKGMSEADIESSMINMTRYDANLELLRTETAKMDFANAEQTNLRGQYNAKTDVLKQQTQAARLQTARLDAQKAESDRVVRSAVNGLMSSVAPKLETEINAVMQNAKNPNRTPEQIAQDQMKLESIISSSIGGVTAMLGADATPSQISMIMMPMEGYINYARGVVNGTAAIENMDTQLATMVAQQTAIAVLDPDILKVVVASEMFNYPAFMVGPTNAAATAVMAGVVNNLNPAPVFDNNDPAKTQAYFDGSKTLTEVALKDGAPPGIVEEAKKNVNGMLRTVASREGNDRRPAEFEQISNHFASDSFGRLMENDPEGFIQQENLDAANRVFEDFYYAEAIPVIKKEWQQAQVRVNAKPGTSGPSAFATPTRNSPVSAVITAVYKGGGVQFKSSLNEGNALREVARLNKELAPVINKVVRMGTHLQRSRDYRKFFDENYGGIFESEGLEGGDAEPGA
jgi:hypothetical protein